MVTPIQAATATEPASLAAAGESGVCLAQAVRVQQSHTNFQASPAHQPEDRRVSASGVLGALL